MNTYSVAGTVLGADVTKREESLSCSCGVHTGTNKNPTVFCSALLQLTIDIFPRWYRNPEGNNRGASKGSNSSAG